MKFCKDCKHVRRDKVFAIASLGLGSKQWEFAKCARSRMWRSAAREMTSPKVRTGEHSFCSTQREFACGPDAKFFEPKEKSDG
jgi:hypothetical protein